MDMLESLFFTVLGGIVGCLIVMFFPVPKRVSLWFEAGLNKIFDLGDLAMDLLEDVRDWFSNLNGEK